MPASAATRVGEACSRIREMALRSFGACPRAGVLIDVRQPAEFGARETACGASGWTAAGLPATMR
jgi:hypothetical protein